MPLVPGLGGGNTIQLVALPVESEEPVLTDSAGLCGPV